MPRTLFDKIWSLHEVLINGDGESLIFIDRHLLHEGSRESFRSLADRGLKVHDPSRNFATADHYVPTTTTDVTAIDDPERRTMVEMLSRNTADAGIALFDMKDHRHGIVHVVGPEQGPQSTGHDHRVRRQPRRSSKLRARRSML